MSWVTVLSECREQENTLSPWEKDFLDKFSRVFSETGRVPIRWEKQMSEIYIERIIEGIPSSKSSGSR